MKRPFFFVLTTALALTLSLAPTTAVRAKTPSAPHPTTPPTPSVPTTSPKIYDKQWEKVKQLQAKGLPTSAIAEVEVIYRMAEKDDNFPQMLKAGLTMMMMRQDISPDSVSVDIQRMEQMPLLTSASAGDDGDTRARRALTHALMASMYDAIADLSSFGEDDERQQQYKQKKEEHLQAAFSDKAGLAGVSVEAYAPIYEKGADSRLFGNDALSLLTDFAVQQSFYDDRRMWELLTEVADIYRRKGMRDAAVLTTIQALSVQTRLKEKADRLSHDDYVQRLHQLYTDNQDTEAAADACYLYLTENERLAPSERYAIAADAKQRWAQTVYKNRFANIMTEVKQPRMEVSIERADYQQQLLTIVLKHSYVRQATIDIRPNEKRKEMAGFDRKSLPSTRTLQFEAVPADAFDTEHTDTLRIDLPAGFFEVIVKADGEEWRTTIERSSVRLIAVWLPKDGKAVYAVDAQSGRPIANCRIVGTWSERKDGKWTDMTETYRTDANGMAQFSDKVNEAYAQRSVCDISPTIGLHTGRYTADGDDSEQTNFAVYTDRAVYRPGQTVQVSGFAYRQQGDSLSAIVGKDVKVQLRDANWQIVATDTLLTDGFGSAHTAFTLPTDRLNGVYTVYFGSQSTQIRVEEYKRPTFFVEFDPTEATYALGDTIELSGVAKTYSGVPVQNAAVSYRTEQREFSFWRWGRQGDWDVQHSGTTTTDADGRFSVRLVLDDSQVAEVMQFRAVAQVTDMAGESHEAARMLTASEREFALNIQMDADVNADAVAQHPVSIVAVTAEQKPAQAAGKWALLAYDKATDEYADTIATGTFATTAQPLSLPQLSRLPLGAYRLTATAVDSKGHDIEAQADFVLWSPTRREKMNLKNDWVYTPKTEYADGETADIWYAIADDDAYTYIYIQSQSDVLQQTIGAEDATIRHARIPFSPQLRDGAIFLLNYVKDGETHQLIKRFTYAEPQKELNVTWSTFRDRLQPGQQETWTLSVRDRQGKPAWAQLVATLYDASLDAIAPHSMPFRLYFRRTTPSYFHYWSSGRYGNAYGSISFRTKWLKTEDREFNILRAYDEYASLYYTRSWRTHDNGMPRVLYHRSVNGAVFDSVVESAMPMASAKMAMADAGVEEEAADMDAAAGSTDAVEAQAPQVTPRENFAETAFFFPTLTTDKNGEVSMSFTLPETLTEWRFIGLAHTTEMDYGSLTATIQAYKDFIVQPNVPRFVRIGDSAAIPTRIINQSEHTISGTATMRLIDPESEQTVSTQTLPFMVEAGQTGSVAFPATFDDRHPMLVCEITAATDEFSDGERHWLPVLASTQHITETIPFYIEDGAPKDIDLSSLFNHNSPTATQRTMTVEYTDNPSWTAVLALQSVTMPTDDNAISWAAALYANRVAQHLASRMPQLQSLIRQWKAEEGNETTLQSELEKNQQLKNILLQETPWVLDAQNETQQRQMLCQLFDDTLLNQRIRQAVEKLTQWQYDNGGWGWYPQMEPNYYTTLACTYHLALLDRYLHAQGIDDDAVQKMLRKGFTFLDEQELKHYGETYKKKPKLLPSESTLNYLYARTISHVKPDNGAVDAMQDDYLRRILKQPTLLTMYGRANTTTLLLATGRKSDAANLVRSLREYTVERADMGRYYDTEKALYSWRDYRIPTHISAMRAMQQTQDLFSDSGVYLQQMLLWLLRQKQVQAWDTPITTIDAVDLLLTLAPSQMTREAHAPVIRIDGNVLPLPQPTAGIGYTKTAVPDSIVARQPSVASIQPTATTGMSYGCIYGQCQEAYSQLGTAGESLTIARKVYRSASSGNKTEWVEITEGTPLHIGDRIRIRHIITADRDMDFVQVRSTRAACLEPVQTRSGYQYLGGRGAYLSIHDASSDIFFDCFYKGTATVDLDMYVTHAGTFQNGIATVQCAYSPTFSGHSSGSTLVVE
ncbi:MAG: hypothetical protein J1F25_03615, partial [Prevotellaceae bacterium]|nr:hypothetical protein [Prevotellaceae bacterium]